jgi:putative SOS response-associated peptidase YedK
MCGRAKLPEDYSETRIVLKVDDVLDGTYKALAPNYNAAPSQMLPVVRLNPETGKRSLNMLQWGLIPRWAKEPGLRPINAKAEGIATKPMFRQAYAKRRCIVVMDGFYEWQAIPGEKRKQPYYITAKDRRGFYVAGIWENWKDPISEEWVRTFAIITTTPNELCSPIHNRMPVILKPDDCDRWLGFEPDPHDLLKPYPAELMEAWPVSTRVNSPANNDPSLLSPLA